MTQTAAPSVASPSRHRGAAALGSVLFIVGAAMALSVDVPRAVPRPDYGIKGDEATYVAAALSAAFDGNLSFDARDLERFAGLFHRGPEGIFLKRGKRMQFQGQTQFPFVQIAKQPDPRTDRLYFGKALIYPVAAAPFVRMFGLNGFLLFHVVLLAIVGVCGYLFLAARSSSLAATAFTTAFLGASTVAVYGVYLTPEIFNFAIVFVAYFLWVYKEVAPQPRLAGARPEIVAAVLLGLVTYSKPSNALLIAPLIAVAWWRRQWIHGLLLGLAFVLAAALCFGATAAVSGEFNYQGGERKTFYGAFPFDAPDATWDRRGIAMYTDAQEAGEVLGRIEPLARFPTNVKYFFVGRHFGFVPYFFPGTVAVLLWLFSTARRDVWRLTTFLALVSSAIVLLLIFPYTWSGGGGPTGNRYLLSVYPVMFFLVPPMETAWPGLLAWAGGALFTAKILLNPFVAAKYTYLNTERGPARRLPVELTMANDLPVMLDASRSRIPYGQNPTLLLYFLDQNASPPEPPGMWVSGGGRAEILVRSSEKIHHLDVTAESPIQTVLTVSMGGSAVSVPLAPHTEAAFTVPAVGTPALRSYAYLLSARSSEGFVPHLRDSSSSDQRNLGALMRFRAVTAQEP